MSYEAKITHIKTRPHPNADRVQLGVVSGYQVVVGLDTEDGQLGVYFPCDGQLSHEMCMANELFRKHPETGKPMGGYFEKNRRVRAQPFRGEKSEGFWVPLTYLEWTGANLSKLKAGDTFTELNGHEVCCKYISPATKRRQQQQAKKGRKPISTVMFKQHYSTNKLRYTVDSIPAGSLVTLTEKLHGTSGRTGYVKVEQDLGPIRQMVNNLFRRHVFEPKTKWKKLTGSRRVNYDPDQMVDSGFYSGDTFRFKVSEDMRLKKGETIYYEIVGFTDSKRPIMGTHTVSDDKLMEQYGAKMVYKYGCAIESGEPWDVYVYRITHANEDGDTVDLSWPQVVARCNELGLKHVPVLHETFVYDGDTDELLRRCAKRADGPSTLDSSHIREGVGVRVEHPEMNTTFKYKGFHFCELEGIAKNDDNYVDPEDL